MNPILEELFWRLFLMKTYKDSEINRNIMTFNYILYHWIALYIMTGKLLYLNLRKKNILMILIQLVKVKMNLL